MSLRTIQGGKDAIIERGRADYLWVAPNGDVFSKQMAIGVGKDEDGDPAPLLPRVMLRNEVILSPAHCVPDPLVEQPSFLVLCETRDNQDRCTPWNHRAALRGILKTGDRQGLWCGIRQGVTFDSARGSLDHVTWERFFGACLDAGLLAHSRQADHFNLGPRSFQAEGDRDPTAVLVADHLIFARHLLHKVGSLHDAVPMFGNLDLYVSTGPMRAGLSGCADALAAMLEGKNPTPILDADKGGVRCLRIGGDREPDPYKFMLSLLPLLEPSPR